jgi:site-specific DNA recombinase
MATDSLRLATKVVSVVPLCVAMDKEKINYFIYARKSTEGEDRQSLSIPSQIEDDVKIQARERLTVCDTITDSASAKIPFNRTGYLSMIKRIKTGEASGIIVWKIDRLARNHLEWGELMHLLQAGVIKSIWTMHREYRSEDSALLISLEASMATQYSVDLSEVVKRGLERKIKMGQPPLIARIGYLNTKLNEHGSNSIIVDEARWPIMRKAFDMMLTGQYTMAHIVSVLNNEYQFRTRPSRNRPGAPLALSMLHRAFTDPFYTGYFKYKGKLHKGSYRPMISLEEFDTIQEVLGRKKKQKPKKHQFSFTGLIKCGSCGGAITATQKTKEIKSTGTYKTYVFYHCTKRKREAVCMEKHYTKHNELEAMISGELIKIALLPEWREWAIETAKLQYEDELAKQEAVLKAASDYEQKLRSEIDTLLDLRISNDISDQQYQEKKALREAQLIRVQERQRRLKGNINDWINQLSNLLNSVGDAEKMFKTGEPKLQKEICELIGWNWILQGRNLTFTKQKWFYSIEKLKGVYEQENVRLEPTKTFMEYRKTASFRASIPYLCGIRDAIRTEIGEKKSVGTEKGLQTKDKLSTIP